MTFKCLQITIKYWQPILTLIVCGVQIHIFFVINEKLRRYSTEYNTFQLNNKTDINFKDIKTILLWSPNCVDCYPFNHFLTGTQVFEDHSCKYQNCYVARYGTDASLIPDESYDAVLFNGKTLTYLQRKELPLRRSQKQRYVFVQLESNFKFPLCQDFYEDYFNWTITYRLDSTIPWPYFFIKDTDSKTIGPGERINWIKENEMLPVDERFKIQLKSKTKLAAIFVRVCRDNSGSIEFTRALRRYLQRYKEDVDVYGKCGIFTCPKRDSEPHCDEIMEKNYKFILAFENAFDKDFITQKVYRALTRNVIPVLYGGANYSRFLPPGSYIDGLKLGPEKLAKLMLDIKQNNDKYLAYFKWKNHYRLTAHTGPEDVSCKLCEKLNEDGEPTIYPHVRRWWNHKETICNRTHLLHRLF